MGACRAQQRPLGPSRGITPLCQSTTAAGSDGDPPVWASFCVCSQHGEKRAERSKTVSGIAQGTVCTCIGNVPGKNVCRAPQTHCCPCVRSLEGSWMGTGLGCSGSPVKL